MTDPHIPSADREPTPVGWWDRAAIIALGGAGCALSYDALQQMAVAIHVRPQLSYLFPLVIDGFIAYGIRALLVMSTAPLRARLYTWTLFATATTASIWANALHAVRLNQQTHAGGLRLGDHVVAVLSTIAPLALAGAVHLYILITRHHPARDTKTDQPGPNRTTTLVPVRADPDGTIRTGSPGRFHHPVRADHTHGLRTERTTDHGPDHTDRQDQACGSQRGPADHAEAGPPERTSGPRGDRADHNVADHDAPDQAGGDHSRPDGPGPSHGVATVGAEHSFEAADQPGGHAEGPATEPQTATEADPDEAFAAQPPSPGPVAGQEREVSTPELVFGEPPADHGDRTEAWADQSGEADQDRGPADRPGTADGDRSPRGTGGPDHPADRGDHPDGPADHASGPPAETSGPNHRADRTPGNHPAIGGRGPEPEEGAGPEPVDVGDQPHARTSTKPPRPAEATDEGVGLEELLPIAREAALSEGRMTRRALRPYLNDAGVPISNQRFTELQQRLYADPALAHLPRPGRRR